MIRFKSGDLKGVPSGYERHESPELTIPSCGISDVDSSIFNLFDKELKFEVGSQNESIKQVPVIFASGEKWAMIKNMRALRDKNDTIILPLITIIRTDILQDAHEDVCGRGINQQTGELVIKRQLTSDDRNYQSIVNKLLIKNQLNIAVKKGEGIPGQIETDRNIGSLANNVEVIDGGLLIPNRMENIWEIITIPSPQFYTAKYKIIFWCQYTTHMNQMIEKLFSSLLTPGNCFKLETNKGYWFIATLDGNSISPDTNFSDQAGQERIIKYEFTMKVPAYILASKAPGMPVPLRRTISAPSIKFAIENTTVQDSSATDDGENGPWLGSDDPSLPISIKSTGEIDQRDRPSELFRRTDLQDEGDLALALDSNGRKINPRGTYSKRQVYDPKTGTISNQYARVVSTTKQGEEVLTGFTLDIKNKI